MLGAIAYGALLTAQACILCVSACVRACVCVCGFPRQEYWSGLPFPSPEELSDSGIETESPALQADSLPLGDQGSPRIKPASLKLEGGFLTTGPPGKSLSCFLINTCILLLSNVLSKTPLTAQTLLELL